MKNKKIQNIIIGIIAVALFSACSFRGGLHGTETKVETSGSKPSIIGKAKLHEQVGNMRRYAGLTDHGHDLDVSIRTAQMAAHRNIVESIATEIRVEGTRGQSGSEGEAVGRFFEDSQSWVTDNIRMSGMTLTETYWERFSRESGASVSYYYRAYAIVEISQNDYEQAKIFALGGLQDKAVREKNRAAEKAAREAKERLLKGGGNGEHE